MRIFERLIQKSLKLISRMLPWREPTKLEGINSTETLPTLCREEGYQEVLIFTDKTLAQLPKTVQLLKNLKAHNIEVTLVDTITPNPTTEKVETLFEAYQAQPFDALIALGGGSVIDVVKAYAVRLAKPKKTLWSLRGLLKVRQTLMPIIAIPTTAGSGSEGTVAAVITDSERGIKFAMTDLSLIPKFAILDPTWLVGLPQTVAAQTGMDALTHAIEAALSQSATKQTNHHAYEAMTLIKNHLQKAISDPHDLDAQKAMLKASHLAGLAFTRAYVGYVHALSHPLSARYNTPHGLANAMLLPRVLRMYGHKIHAKLIAFNHHLALENADDPNRFIQFIEALNDHLGMPKTLPEIEDKDIAWLIQQAKKEIHPTYPVPTYLKDAQLRELYQSMSPKEYR